MARPERFELPTAWFVARYSIQLSYGRVVCIAADAAPTDTTIESCGGERGIRTLDTLLTYTPLAGERFRPLSHLSESRIAAVAASTISGRGDERRSYKKTV